MKTQIRTVKQVAELIKTGKTLLIAGDEKLLKQLPKGSWIAGTIPYLMDYSGGILQKVNCLSPNYPAMCFLPNKWCMMTILSVVYIVMLTPMVLALSSCHQVVISIHLFH